MLTAMPHACWLGMNQWWCDLFTGIGGAAEAAVLGGESG